MYYNLDAEQARYGLSNADLANYLGISRVSYERKKHSGKFTTEQARALCELLGCDFEYLFSKERKCINI